MAHSKHEEELNVLRVYMRQLEARLLKVEKKEEGAGSELATLKQENEALRADIAALEQQLAQAVREKQEAQNKLTDVENSWDHMVADEKRARTEAGHALVSVYQNLDDVSSNLSIVSSLLGGTAKRPK